MCIKKNLGPIVKFEIVKSEGIECKQIGASGNTTMEACISAACANGYFNGARWFAPALRGGVPEGQIVARERQRDSFLAARQDLDVGEASEQRRRLARRCGHVQVELRDLTDEKQSAKHNDGLYISTLTSPPNTEPVFFTSNVTT